MFTLFKALKCTIGGGAGSNIFRPVFGIGANLAS